MATSGAALSAQYAEGAARKRSWPSAQSRARAVVRAATSSGGVFWLTIAVHWGPETASGAALIVHRS